MANTINFSIRMDSDIKKQCEAPLNHIIIGREEFGGSKGYAYYSMKEHGFLSE